MKTGLSLRTKLLYGIGGIADNAMYTIEGTFALFFLTSVAGLRPGVAGLILAVGALWEVLCGPVAGYLSDNTLSRYGKRKPFLLIAALPVALTMWLLFTTVHVSYAVKVIYYFAVMLLFQMTFSSFFVPYMAWGSDLTEDYNERTVLRSYAYVFNQVGMAIGMVLPTAMVDLLMRQGLDKYVSWSVMGAVVGIMSGVPLLVCALGIHKDDDPDFVKPEGYKLRPDLSTYPTIIRDFARIIKVRPVTYIVGVSLLYLLANTFFMSDRVYFFTYNLGLSAGNISFIMLLITVLGVALTPFVAALSVRIDKKNMFMLGIGATGLAMMAARIIGVGSFAGCCAVGAVYTFGNTCYWQLMPSMIYDACGAEELLTGTNHSGQVISLQAMSESLSVAASSQILGIILEVAGFDAEASAQSVTSLAWISNCFTFIPGLAMVMVALLMFRYPVDAMRFGDIMEALETQRAGGVVDMSAFEDIYGKQKH